MRTRTISRLVRLTVAALGMAAGAAAQSAIIFTNDFEANAAGMSGAGVRTGTEGYAGIGFGTQYFRNDAAGNPAAASVLTFGVGSNATGVSLAFSLALIDSWDGAGPFGPDFFNVRVDGNTVFSMNFNIFGAPTVAPELTLLHFGPHLAANTGWGDQAYNVVLLLGNLGAGTHNVEFFSSGVAQGGLDESFAIDNVFVRGEVGVPPPNPTPEPSMLALLGFAVAGLAWVRRRKR